MTSNIFSWISCGGFNQGIRPTPRATTQSPWLRGSWLPSGNWGKWLDAQGEGTICGLFIFYWTLSTSNLRVISVQAAPKTFPVDHPVFGSSKLNGQGRCLRGRILRAMAAKGRLGEFENSPLISLNSLNSHELRVATHTVLRVPGTRRGRSLIIIFDSNDSR